MFETEHAYFDAHKAELREKHLGKFIVVSGDKLIGIYDNPGKANAEALKVAKPGEYMLSPIYATDDEYAVKFRNRVIIHAKD